MRAEHRYGAGSVRADRVTCACGHVEPFSGDAELPAALERLNVHIRNSYTAEAWEELMAKCKVATVDGTTGVVTPPPEGDNKS